MRKMCKCLSNSLGVTLILLIASQGIWADPIYNQKENHAEESDEIAHGRMGGAGGQPRGGRGAGGVRPSGGSYIREGGSGRVFIQPSYPPNMYSQPSSPVYNDELPSEAIPVEEEAQVPIHDLPSFNLSNETPIVHTGAPVIVKVSDIQAQQPISIFWRWADEEWQTGGATFQKTATKPGRISVSVVIQDGEGLYSQIQTIEIDVQTQPLQLTKQLPIESQVKRYYDMPPQDNKEPPQPPPQTDEQTATDIFGVTELDTEVTARLKKELETSIIQLHQWESYVQADLKIKTDCETQLSMIRINSIGADTDEPLKQEQMYVDCLTRVKEKLKKAQEEIEKLKKNIEKLNGILN